MAITFQPTDVLRKIAPDKLVEKLITQRLTVNRAALVTLSKVGFLSKSTLEKLVLKVLKTYKENYQEGIDAGDSKSQALGDAVNEKALLLQRVQNAAVFEVAQEIKAQYEGTKYRWLPSTADVPSPEHQLNYGKVFILGVGDDNGEDPGDRYGCQCGMEIITEDDESGLEL